MFSVSFHGFNGKILSLSKKNSRDKKADFSPSTGYVRGKLIHVHNLCSS